MSESERLSPRARRAIRAGSNEVFLSAASAWEIAIKTRLGRLRLGADPETFVPDQMSRNALLPLPVLVAHALKVAALPDTHRDPFDRLLVAQAMVENLTLVSADRTLRAYGIDVVW